MALTNFRQALRNLTAWIPRPRKAAEIKEVPIKTGWRQMLDLVSTETAIKVCSANFAMYFHVMGKNIIIAYPYARKWKITTNDILTFRTVLASGRSHESVRDKVFWLIFEDYQGNFPLAEKQGVQTAGTEKEALKMIGL